MARLVNTPLGATALLLVGLLLLGTLLLHAGSDRPSVLIVHSQNEHIPWTRGIDAGIRHVLQEPGPMRVQRQYLQRNHNALSATAQTNDFIASWQPDVVMLVDDLAQRGITRHYRTSPPTPTVYVGIEDHGVRLSSSRAAHIQGIIETTPWQTVEESLLRLWVQRFGQTPSAPLKIALLADTGAAAQEEAQGFVRHHWQSMQPLGVWHCRSLAEWTAALTTIAQTADVVVMGDYRYMPAALNHSPLAWRKLLAQTALNALHQPMTALSAYAVADGIPLGILPSPFEQGKVAALMAQQVTATRASGRTARLPQHMQSQHFALLLHPQQLKQHNLSVDALDTYFARLSARANGLPPP